MDEIYADLVQAADVTQKALTGVQDVADPSVEIPPPAERHTTDPPRRWPGRTD